MSFAIRLRLRLRGYFNAGMQVGTDANANLLRDFLQHSGVKLDYLREIEGPTGSAIILLQPSGMACVRPWADQAGCNASSGILPGTAQSTHLSASGICPDVVGL